VAGAPDWELIKWSGKRAKERKDGRIKSKFLVTHLTSIQASVSFQSVDEESKVR
jgi:hypothetical protein